MTASGTGLGLHIDCPSCGAGLTLGAREVETLMPGDVIVCPGPGCGCEFAVTAPGRSGVMLRRRGPVFACPSCAASLEVPAPLLGGAPGALGEGRGLRVYCPQCKAALDLG